MADLEAFADADLIVVADGVNSRIRELYAAKFEPEIDWRPNRFTWLGTTRPFPAFTFLFKEDRHGLWRAHAYRFDAHHSTFIVETTEATWRRAGLDRVSEDESTTFCERLFAEELAGHRLLKNRSIWRSFPTVRNRRWSHGKIVLLGDAAHTAHFSIGSGTKLAMEDAISLASAIEAHPGIDAALSVYEAERRPVVASTQRAAQTSLQWFEETERYFGRLEPLQFAASLLTRSLRITHQNLKLRDPALIRRIDAWFAGKAANQSGVNAPAEPPPPPMFTLFRLRDLVLHNRVVVSPMCMYSAEDGMPNDWHLVHLGSRAVGGAGLVMTEMTDISPEARITPGCAGLWKDEQAQAWRRVVDFVHANSPAKIGVQLAHAGRKGSTRLMWEGIDEPLADGNWPLLAPSPIPYLPHGQVPKAMDRADMLKVREDFVRAARLADAAGFDILEIHFAHGYLLSSFLTPLANRREDEYGGSLENRMRFPLEVFDAVREAWPAGKPISVRISATDWVPGGFDGADAVEIARMLKAHRCDIVDVSAGQTTIDAKPEYGRLFQTPYYWTHRAAVEQGYALPWPKQYCSIEQYQPRSA